MDVRAGSVVLDRQTYALNISCRPSGARYAARRVLRARSADVSAYSYDNAGHRLGFSDTNKTTSDVNFYTFGHDPHGSVSQLIALGGDTVTQGEVEASYGYDAYGGQDKDLTRGDSDNQAPLNPYRYTDKRIDSATATKADGDAQYDMGARRWTPENSRFLQQDIFYGALANLGLATDPLTQNTYALAGANPISFVETDGHRPIANGSGGAIGSSACLAICGTSGSANTVINGITSGVGIERTATSNTADAERAVQALTQFFKKTGSGSTDRLEFVLGAGQVGADTLQLYSDANNPMQIAAMALGKDIKGPSAWYEDAVTELGFNTNSVAYKIGEISATVGGGGAGIVRSIGTGLTKLGRTLALGGFGNPLAMVPKHASKRLLTPSSTGGSQVGVEFKWVNKDGQKIRLRAHDADGTAPPGSNAASGPTYRVQIGGRYADAQGKLYPKGVHNPKSPNYDPAAANATHIPWPEGIPLPW